MLKSKRVITEIHTHIFFGSSGQEHFSTKATLGPKALPAFSLQCTLLMEAMPQPKYESRDLRDERNDLNSSFKCRRSRCAYWFTSQRRPRKGDICHTRRLYRERLKLAEEHCEEDESSGGFKSSLWPCSRNAITECSEAGACRSFYGTLLWCLALAGPSEISFYKVKLSLSALSYLLRRVDYHDTSAGVFEVRNRRHSPNPANGWKSNMRKPYDHSSER